MSLTTSQLEQQILDHLVAHFEAPSDATVETSFEVLEFDSLAIVELSLALTKMYSVELDDAEVKKAGSASGLAALLLNKGVTRVAG
ncbi:acyl carrier protein [Streptomyces sp. BBFR51]|uniref:acyl carrier protein n=1 Tax=Streptomyces sp. BBFR51 TaxID=3372856 RepID=UPI0037DC728C